MALEEKIIENDKNQSSKFDNPLGRYLVDVSSGWTYYTLAYGIQEALAGKDFETICTTRGTAMVTHLFTRRLIGQRRDKFAEIYGITKESPFIDKCKLNVMATTPIQAVSYAAILISGMGLSQTWDWESTAYSWLAGVALGAVHSIPAGFVQDKFRSFFGIPQAVKQKG